MLSFQGRAITLPVEVRAPSRRIGDHQAAIPNVRLHGHVVVPSGTEIDICLHDLQVGQHRTHVGVLKGGQVAVAMVTPS